MAAQKNPIAQLFQIKQTIEHTQPTQISLVSDDTKLQGETYVYYGTRICGRVTASLQALSAILPRVYALEKQRQIEDIQLQENHKRNLVAKLNETNSKISAAQTNLEKAENIINDNNEAIERLKEKLIDAQNLHGQVNKMARIKMILGIVIISILTLYLFIFYSSTFYSAFFKQFDINNMGLGDAMFDPLAISKAFSTSISEILFILTAPIIFMGLGYGLHFFMQQEKWTKYLKTSCVLFITFAFDCILAYLIAEKIYNIMIITKLGEYPDYSISLAIKDMSFWAVIFCGFIVYLIWGIVFDMTMTAYENLRSNKREILILESNIMAKRETISKEKLSMAEDRAKIDDLNRQRDCLLSDISQNVHIDTHIIKTALADFFAGWMTMMASLSRPTIEQNEAHKIYQTTITRLFN